MSTVGENKNGIAKYIREQEHEDIIYDQLSFKEWEDPFKKIAGANAVGSFSSCDTSLEVCW